MISANTDYMAEEELKTRSKYSRLGLDYAYIHITDHSEMKRFLTHPMRLKSVSVILCLRGCMEIDINTSHYSIRPNSLMAVTMGNVLSIREINTEEFEACVLMISNEFLSGLNFDINVINSVNFEPGRPPFLQVSEREMKLLKAYFDLIHYNTMENTDPIFVKSISRNLFAAAIYQMLQIVSRVQGVASQRETSMTARASRCHNYVRDFHNLVLLHHREHRNVAFYASKLFLSSKYLSHIIKEMTGRSAAEWIDHYVILEAKNMLRYSGKNVQQVAYDLNFPNQSAFGKYFKHITGMSPTQFQRS